MIYLLKVHQVKLIHCSSIPFHVSHLEEGFSSNVLGPHSMAKTQQTNEPQAGLAGTFKIDFKKNKSEKRSVCGSTFLGPKSGREETGKNNLSDWPDTVHLYAPA